MTSPQEGPDFLRALTQTPVLVQKLRNMPPEQLEEILTEQDKSK